MVEGAAFRILEARNIEGAHVEVLIQTCDRTCGKVLWEPKWHFSRKACLSNYWRNFEEATKGFSKQTWIGSGGSYFLVLLLRVCWSSLFGSTIEDLLKTLVEAGLKTFLETMIEALMEWPWRRIRVQIEDILWRSLIGDHDALLISSWGDIEVSVWVTWRATETPSKRSRLSLMMWCVY